MERIWTKHKQSFDMTRDKLNATLKPNVFVAMSGGVDSSVAAALLKKQGYNVTGVFMKPWDPGVTRNSSVTSNSIKQLPVTNYQLPVVNCLWQQDREDAMRAAATLGIPFKTWDFSREYKKEVTNYMISEYRAGRTPNPDVMCNDRIKFGVFLRHALKSGADYIATGHYIRLIRKSQIPNPKSQTNSKFKIPKSQFKLFQAKDQNKDQSYFLWTLTQDQLKYCLFPIGDYIKPEVRKLAKEFGLPNHDKRDSQGVCFIGPLNIKDFLKKYIKPKAGTIIDKDGNEIGQHDGVYYYTIGQRHGLNISNGQGPYFVRGKDVKKNVIYVGKKDSLDGKSTFITDFSWINKVKLPVKIDVKIRYRSKSGKAILSKNGRLEFVKPIRAITPGQSAVFYRGKEMLGGGIIQ